MADQIELGTVYVASMVWENDVPNGPHRISRAGFFGDGIELKADISHKSELVIGEKSVAIRKRYRVLLEPIEESIEPMRMRA